MYPTPSPEVSSRTMRGQLLAAEANAESRLAVTDTTSISGIVSGVILAIARIIGETAPLLVTMGFTDSMNTNALPTGSMNPMTALPVFVYYEYTRPGRPQQAYFDRAWTGALVLVLIVMILNIIGRYVAKRFAPKINR